MFLSPTLTSSIIPKAYQRGFAMLAAMVMFLTNMKEAEGEFIALIWFPTLGSKDLKKCLIF